MPKAKTKSERTQRILAEATALLDKKGMTFWSLRDILVQDYLHRDDSVSNETLVRWIRDKTTPRSEVILAIKEWIIDNRK